MAGLDSALRIATSGINTAQTALGTVSHNITNVNTQGFHRQTPIFGADSNNGFGAGVSLTTIQRQADNFLQTRITGQISAESYALAYADKLEGLETILGDPTSDTGLDKLFNNLFTEMSTLANRTDSSAAKRNAVQQADLVADTLNNMYNDIVEAQTRADEQIDENIAVINGILENIHELNQEISAQILGSVNGATANDLIDQRQSQLDRLATYFGIQVDETANGAVRVTTENGRQLIDVATYSQLERSTNTPFNDIAIRRILVNDTPANTTLEINMNTVESGSMKALVDVRDTFIPNMIAELNGITSTFMDEFNRLHSQGSSFPPQATLTSGNTGALNAATDDITTAFGSDLNAGDTFHISVVDSTGDTLFTTVNTGLAVTGTGPITIGASPFTLDDLVTLINNNADVGNTALGGTDGALASTGTNADGDTIFQISVPGGSSGRIVLSNATGDVLGTLGMNNFFTGTDATDIAVRSDIAASPELIATARMRATDAGLSSLDNQNALELAQLSETSLSFSSAGGMPALTDSVTGYTAQWMANFAVLTSAAQDQQEFNSAMLTEMQQQQSEIIGVNVDEELTNMLIYQTSFQASARIVQTVDDLMQYLIQVVGG